MDHKKLAQLNYEFMEQHLDSIKYLEEQARIFVTESGCDDPGTLHLSILSNIIMNILGPIIVGLQENDKDFGEKFINQLFDILKRTSKELKKNTKIVNIKTEKVDYIG